MQALILQVMKALHQKSVWPHNIRFFDTARILRYSTCGDHARMQEYNDSTHHACVTNYGFTYITLSKYSLT